jgi:hypothetical protein
MRGSRFRRDDRGDYSGPTRRELGGLAEWVGGEQTQLSAEVPPLDWSAGPVAKRPRFRSKGVEDYAGPTQAELGSLAVLAAAGTPDCAAFASSPRPPDSSLSEITAELSMEELIETLEGLNPETGARRGANPERPPSDDFLRQLDNVQASLRRRVSASPSSEM